MWAIARVATEFFFVWLAQRQQLGGAFGIIENNR
jgi:hypothetical protein